MSKIGVVIIVHPCKNSSLDSIITLANEIKHSIYTLSKEECETVIIESTDIDTIRNKLNNILNMFDKLIIAPLLVRRGSHFRDIEKVVQEISEGSDKVYITPPLLDIDMLRYSLISEIVLKLNIRNIYRRLVEETGDSLILSELRSNVSEEDFSRIFKKCKIMVTDDIRVLAFLDIGKIFPGLKVMFEERTSEFSYTPQSLLVLCRRALAIRHILKNINQGVRPELIIAVPPALSRDEIELKRSLLKLDIPVIVTVGSRGGPHIAGTLLSSLLGDYHERGQT